LREAPIGKVALLRIGPGAADDARSALEALYPRRHLFTVANVAAGGCEAIVEIPLDARGRKAPAAETAASRRESA